MLEKYQKQHKKFLEIEDELKKMKSEVFQNRFKNQIEIMDKQLGDANLKIKGLNNQIKENNEQIYKYKQQAAGQQVAIEQLQQS